MGVFTFVLRKSGDEWTTKQCSGDIEGSSPSTYEIQQKLVKAVLAVDSSRGFSPLSLSFPLPLLFQVVVGGAVYVSGGAAATAAPAGGVVPASEATPATEDDDMGFSLFD